MSTDGRGSEPPERLGPYRLDQLLGSGGMGAVWRAWDERLERWVALKHIRADVTLHQGRERLRREARAAARLNHPSIVHVYDLVESPEGDWIVMELIAGKTVRHLLAEEVAFAPERAVKLCREIAEGLAEAHAQGVLHRDLKAANVIVTSGGRAKILDFGLAKELPREWRESAPEPTLSLPGHLLGTCYAMSPEQVLGHSLDERSDLFSLGALLYEMLTGEAPFRGETAAQALANVVHLALPPLTQSHPAIPSAVCDLVDWLLQKRPQDRPRSAAEVLQALETAAGFPGHGIEPWLRRASSRPSDEPTAVTLVEGQGRFSDRPTPDEGKRSSGERRIVTIACCALVLPDRASGEAALDIEVLSEATMAFERLAQEICQELAGSLGGVFSRTLWLCFGYPLAHENDAERAVRAARRLQERSAALPLVAAHRLAVRTGVHTGPTVVMTRASSGQTIQPGETFEIAVAIQSQAPVGRIGVSEATRQLLARRFATEPLPPVHLKDHDTMVAVYELGPPLEPGSRESGPWIPLVNREAELQILLDRFALARSGSGQAVLIVGEAGIGKSRLVQALSEQLAPEAPAWLLAHGSTFAQNTPLAPIIDLLARTILLGDDGTEGSAEAQLQRLEEALDRHGLPRPDFAPLLGSLLSLPIEHYPPLVLSPEAQRKRTLAAVAALLGAQAERHPTVLVVEDLHWIDPSTLELLDLLLAELPHLPLLLVVTFRSEFKAPWRHQTAATQLYLSGLNDTQVTQLIERVAEGKRLPSEVHREIVARTDGIPLFVEELTKAVLEADAPGREPAGIPFTLGASLLARLDHLGEAKAVAQLAAVIGRTFTLELLEALSWIEGAALYSALDRLVQAEILYRRGPAQGARFIFKHALIQDTAYLSLLASDRQQLHRRLAVLLQEEFPEVAEAEPEVMAHHCERGGLTAEAVESLQRAGLRDIQRSAPVEAVSHLSRALSLLLELPPGPERSGQELELRSLLITALELIKGWGDPEVAVHSERCVALCRELGHNEGLIPALSSLWAHHLIRGNHQALDLAEEIARLAETPAQIYMGYASRAYTAHFRGRYREALTLSERATKVFEPGILPELAVYGDDSILMPFLLQSWSSLITGETDRALRKLDDVITVAETLRSPFARGMALLCEMTLLRDLRVEDPERLEDVSDRLLKLSGEQEFAFLQASACCGKGWAVCLRGDLARGTALIETGLDLYAATGTRLLQGYWCSYRIQALLAAGRLDEGLAATREILALLETQLDVNLEAEFLYLEGDLLRASGETQAAEVSYRRSLDVARQNEARLFELRAATGLGRLLAEQGRAAEALPLLTAVYESFHEGIEHRDFREARELLDQLSRLPIL